MGDPADNCDDENFTYILIQFEVEVCKLCVSISKFLFPHLLFLYLSVFPSTRQQPEPNQEQTTQPKSISTYPARSVSFPQPPHLRNILLIEKLEVEQFSLNFPRLAPRLMLFIVFVEMT